jgi:hypothetical protein
MIPVIGFNASAQTGYDSGAALHLASVKSGKFYHYKLLCGTADDPGGTPRQLRVNPGR